VAVAADTRTKPLLLFFFSPSDGRSRRVEAFLAQALQRNHNHDTFSLREIDVTKHPKVAKRFRVEELPVLCVVEQNRVAARVVAPRGNSSIRAALSPWLRR
jgi:thioredoxin-like negative regulator of GroEL